MEKFEDRVEKLRATLKEKDFKLTEVTCQLTTAELKMKLLEDQIEIFDKDLKRINDGSISDNLSDAIEVSCRQMLSGNFTEALRRETLQ